MPTDADYMKLALSQAEEAAARGEVPVGAVAVNPETGRVLAADGNRSIEMDDPTAHAEMLVIRETGRLIGNYRLSGVHLFVTLEPCAMCAGAISFARIARLVYAAPDPKGGAIAHGPQFFTQGTCHHRPAVESGLCAAASSALLKNFFLDKR